MKRRAFLKCTGLCGASVSIPTTLTMSSLWNGAYAASPNYNGVNYVAPDTSLTAATNAFPQVINVFLYGGPSELAANLTNIQELNDTSQNAYTDSLGNGIIQSRNATTPNGLITPRSFWFGAGGDPMEFLVTKGHMSVYRTMMKRAEDTQSHRQSIFMNQKGTLDIDDSPGIGTRIAKMLEVHASGLSFPHPILGSRPLDGLVLPFVSFEGETVLYAPDVDVPLNSLRLKAVTMNENFENPYTRNINGNNTALTDLVNAVQTAAVRARYSKVANGFDLRDLMDGFIGNLQTSFSAPLPIPLPTETDDLLADIDPDPLNGGRLIYPNSPFARQIRAAVTLAIENPDSKFITVSNGGLGGFDDHNNGIDNYPQRMEQLFTALRAAMKHIKYSGTQTDPAIRTPGGLERRTDNIIINVFGDFGRRVNLNDSMGWDHGNCQILYTLGGQSVRGAAALGKVVGTTQRVGRANTNDQYLEPTSDSYEFEPMSMAASIYRYFGAQNPEIMTIDPNFYPSGRPAINEAVDDEYPLL